MPSLEDVHEALSLPWRIAGHYIIAYLLARRGFVDEDSGRKTAGSVSRPAISGADGEMVRVVMGIELTPACHGSDDGGTRRQGTTQAAAPKVASRTPGKRTSAGKKAGQGSTELKGAGGGSSSAGSAGEAAVLVTLAGLYNYLLFTYGLEY